LRDVAGQAEGEFHQR